MTNKTAQDSKTPKDGDLYILLSISSYLYLLMSYLSYLS